MGSLRPIRQEVPYRNNSGDTTGLIGKCVWRQVNKNSNNIEIVRTTNPKVITPDLNSMYPEEGIITTK